MDNYNKAYKEITEILQYIPQESLEKIPQIVLDVFNTNKDNTYVFSIDRDKSFEEQSFLDETKAILAVLFQEYWATPQQKQVLNYKENEDRTKSENEKRKQYSIDVFATNITDAKEETSKEEYDEIIITSNTNNTNDHLVLKKKLESIPNEFLRGWYSNTMNYDIFTSNGVNIGYIFVRINETDSVEIEYKIIEAYRNNGNMSISLEEVLKDIFTGRVLDGMIINDRKPKTEIKSIILNINEFNDASQRVARKNGFKNQGGYYEITKDGFIQSFKYRFEKIKKIVGTLKLIDSIRKMAMNFSTTSKDSAEKRITNDVRQLQNRNRLLG